MMVPVLTVSQLSRAVEHRGERRPQLADLRESGAIEQDADVVLFIYREGHGKHDATDEERNATEIIIAKHRNGPTGSIKLRFDHERVVFKTIDKRFNEEMAGVAEDF